MIRLGLVVASWFGCGYSRVAPGTVGSAAAIAIAWLAAERLGTPGWAFALLAVALVPAGVWAAGVAAAATQKEDPGVVVVDEVLGQWLTLGGAAVIDWKTLAGGFLLFRLFDIWKPWPVRKLESLAGGIGIVADDLMAGFYGALVLWLAGWFNH